MKEEVQRWWKQAQSDLRAAQDSVSSKSFDWACFQAQQAAEKGLKSLFLKKFEELRKVHDIVFLAEKLGAPPHITLLCSKLNKVYTETRYPDVGEKIPAEKFSQKDAEDFVTIAKNILLWLQKELSNN